MMQHLNSSEQRRLRLRDFHDHRDEIMRLPVKFTGPADGLDRVLVTRRKLLLWPQRNPMSDYYYVLVSPITKEPLRIENPYTNLKCVTVIDSFPIEP